MVVHADSTPYRPDLRARLVAAFPPATTTLAEVCELDTLIGQAFAEVAAAIVAGVPDVELIVSHGQTVFHWVEGAHALGTLQLGQAAWIAERTGVPVVSDVRIRDITAGGHGAPLVSYLDTLLLAGTAGRAAALNLGGISNMTVVDPAGPAYAFDIGPANALVDAVVARTGADANGYDTGGRLAAAGQVHDGLLAELLDDAYYDLPAPKSTGKEHFHGDYVDAAVARAGVDLAVSDLVATLTELTVRTVARDVAAAGVSTLVVSGGGCHNPVVMAGLRAALPGRERDDLRRPRRARRCQGGDRLRHPRLVHRCTAGPGTCPRPRAPADHGSSERSRPVASRCGCRSPTRRRCGACGWPRRTTRHRVG